MWKKLETQYNPIERGRYLVTLGGCNDCHTPKIAGPDGIPVPDTKGLVSIPDRASAVSWSFGGTECVPRAKINESSKPVAFAVVSHECIGFCI